MAFPTIPTVGAGRVLWQLATNPAGTHTSPSLSSLTKNSGDLLIAGVIIYDGNSTNAEFSSWGGGFTEFKDQAGTATMGIGLAYKWSDGTETGTFTVTSADASANDSAFFLLSIPGAHPSTPPEAGTMATGTAPDVASFDPSGWGAEDTLWIMVGASGETATTGSYTGISAPPANYGNESQSGISADAVGGVEGAVAFRQLNASSENPAAYTMDTSNARGAAILIAVRPDPLQTLTLGLLDSGSALYAPRVLRNVGPYAAEVLADSPLGYWPLNESSGETVVVDYSGNNHPGSYVGTVTGGETGGVPGATSTDFDGSADYISVADHADFDLANGAWTIEAWVYLDTAAADPGRAVLSKGAGGPVVRLTGTPTADLQILRSHQSFLHNPFSVPVGAWHHIAVAYEGANGAFRSYIDGGSEDNTDPGLSDFVSNAVALTIGYDTDEAPWDGNIQHVAFYGTALSAGRIAAHFAAAGGASEIVLGLLDAGPALYAPTITPKNLISLGLLDASPALYAPTVTPTNTLTLGLLDAGPALFAPTVIIDQFITLGLLDAGPTLYAPTITPQWLISLGLLDASSALYAPTVIAGPAALTLPLLDAGSALYAPTLLPGPVGITLGLLDSGSALYAPMLGFTISLGLLDSGSALYAPMLGFTMALPLLDSGPTLYAPTIVGLGGVQSITLGLLDAGSALYAPTLLTKNTITLALLDAGPALFAPTLTRYNTLTLGLLDASPTLFAPTIILAPYPIVLPLLDAGPALYAPTVQGLSPGFNIFLPLLESVSELYPFTIVLDTDSLQLRLIAVEIWGDIGPISTRAHPLRKR